MFMYIFVPFLVTAMLSLCCVKATKRDAKKNLANRRLQLALRLPTEKDERHAAVAMQKMYRAHHPHHPPRRVVRVVSSVHLLHCDGGVALVLLGGEAEGELEAAVGEVLLRVALRRLDAAEREHRGDEEGDEDVHEHPDDAAVLLRPDADRRGGELARVRARRVQRCLLYTSPSPRDS